MLLRERIVFRDLALSHWLEQEVPVERGDDIAALAKAVSVFSTGVLSIDSEATKAYVDQMVPVPLGNETALPTVSVAQS